MVTLARRVARTPLGPALAVMFGLVAAILVGAAPASIFERAVVASGLPGVLTVATPPLGLTARILVMLFAAAFVGCAIVVFSMLIDKASNARARTPWRDAGYDEPVSEAALPARRRPIFAPEELGAPLMSDEAIAPREAAPETSAEIAADAPMEAEVKPMLKIDAIAAAMNEVPAPSREPATPPADPIDHSIAGLIARLEAGLARRVADMPPGGGAPLALPPEWIVDDKPPPTDLHGEESGGESAMRKFAWR